MKVIFLDIDGVMNSQVFYHERFNTIYHKSIRLWYKIYRLFIKAKAVSLENYTISDEHWKFDYVFKRLTDETDKTKWEWLSEFCNENDYKICISSVWKNHFNQVEDWGKALVKLGFNDNIFVGITGNRRTNRGTEIAEWLAMRPDYNKYAILDDDSDMLSEQMQSFFHVDGYYGLTPNILYRVKLYLDK